ncbi:hypothetical protein GCM10027578_21830 [Spirosoma luteolum]
MPDNYAEVSAMRKKFQQEAHTANQLRSCTNEIRVVVQQFGRSPEVALQKISEILSHYKI